MTSYTISTCDEHPAIDYAAEELARCLKGAGLTVTFGGEGDFRLGLLGSFAELDDGEEDGDEIVVESTEKGGILAGSNPRSVLFAVYSYLREMGFSWVRPGADGEVVPDLTGGLPAAALRQRASYRHRGVCIEGAISGENAVEMVEWMARAGFNAYFIQFQDAFTFFDRWYSHLGNPALTKEAFAREDAARLTRQLRAEIKRRGMDLHMVGHGWTCEPFGIPGPGWYQHEGPVPKEARKLFAEIGGKRELWGGIALNTNLCYGHADARRIVTDAIADWAGSNADVDVIHFWLADGTNNNCECPLCRDTRPADFYVQMLNQLDDKLSAHGIDTRIVFLVYVDLLWPPETELELGNPDRFLLMFAPITRSYSTPFAASPGTPPELPPFERNKLTFPSDPGENLAFLKSWQELFPCEGFDFDYHFMWDHHKDPGQYAMAKVLHQDIQRLRDIGLGGLVSCQNQRVFFPAGLGMTVLGRTLWDREAHFEDIAEQYFASAFGEEAPAARKYLASVSELINPKLLRGEASDAERQAARLELAKVADLVADLGPALERGLADCNPARAASWRYLALHGEFVRLYADAVAARLAESDAEEKARALFQWAREHELELQPLLDVFEFQRTLGPLFGIPREELTG